MRKVTKLWKTKDGRKIRICDMSDDHLINTIKMLERNVDCMKAEIPFPNFSGEMAQYYAEGDYQHLQDATPEYFIPIYEDLFNELDRRGLTPK